jgi:hypothetical protein
MNLTDKASSQNSAIHQSIWNFLLSNVYLKMDERLPPVVVNTAIFKPVFETVHPSYSSMNTHITCKPKYGT